MLVTFTAMLDRYLPAIALGPMKNDLGLSDTSVSLVQGVAFSLFYCIAGIPLGRAVDRYNRRNLVALAVLERSEEHTSELKSLMRIAYAVFCLKQKNQFYNTHICKS